MPQAVIFDYDGVLIDSETGWDEVKPGIITEVAGPDIAAKVGVNRGWSLAKLWQLLRDEGSSASFDDMVAVFERHVGHVYGDGALARGAVEAIQRLHHDGYLVGVVSASPLEWINIGIDRMGIRDQLTLVISLNDREDLAHKPAPDGYLEAMHRLGAMPAETVVVEDSELGIASGKAAGAYVIATQEMAHPDISQAQADEQIDDLTALAAVVERHFRET
jgi:HAD superfamily hydrolase (TIGR01509 family)